MGFLSRSETSANRKRNKEETENVWEVWEVESQQKTTNNKPQTKNHKQKKLHHQTLNIITRCFACMQFEGPNKGTLRGKANFFRDGFEG